MTGEGEEVSKEDLARLRLAARTFSRAEVSRIAEAVVDHLRGQPAVGTFDEVTARHLWDEYCWALQDGPFDDEIDWGGGHVWSLSGAFDVLVRDYAQAEVEKLPNYALVFLTVEAIYEDSSGEADEDVGSVWVDGIVSLIVDVVKARASNRNLDLIGPDRDDLIGYHIEGTGMVWSVLHESDEPMDIVTRHSDVFLDPNGDLKGVADEMVDAFIAALSDDDERSVISLFLERFDDQVRALIREYDVLPSLEDMRGGLLDRLDA